MISNEEKPEGKETLPVPTEVSFPGRTTSKAWMLSQETVHAQWGLPLALSHNEFLTSLGPAPGSFLSAGRTSSLVTAEHEDKLFSLGP